MMPVTGKTPCDRHGNLCKDEGGENPKPEYNPDRKISLPEWGEEIKAVFSVAGSAIDTNGGKKNLSRGQARGSRKA